jgi:DNA-binding beta-propeller fold protein YncE
LNPLSVSSQNPSSQLRTVSSVIQVGHSPRTIGVAPDGRFAYASNGRDNTVSVLDVAR